MKLLFLFCVALVSTQCNAESQLSIICRKTSNYDFCVQTLGSDPRSQTADTHGLTQIALDKITTNANGGSSYVQGLQGSATAKEAPVVHTCIQAYTLTAGEIVPRAINSFNGNAYAQAKLALTVAISSVQACVQRVDQNPSPVWEMLTKWNTVTIASSQVSIDLLGLLH